MSVKNIATLLLVLTFLFSGIITVAFAAKAPPKWTSLTAEQKQFLMEAFKLDKNNGKLYWEPLPDDMKQFLIDNIWKTITPEKQQQILLYAHIDTPFSEASNEASKYPAPKWNSLSAKQQALLTDSLNLDVAQRGIWNNLPVDIKQLYIEAIWPYIATEKKNAILSGGSNTVSANQTPTPSPNTNPYNNNTPVASQAPRWDSLTPQQQQALMVLFNFDSTKQMLWTYLTPELKQMFIDYAWQYIEEDIKQCVMKGDMDKLKKLQEEQAQNILPPPQWNTLDAKGQGKLMVLMKLDPTLWNPLPAEGKQFFINTVWSLIPYTKQKQIMDEID